MTEKRENTKELKFSIWETDWADKVGDALQELMTDFDVFDANKNGDGYFKVTIVYMQEDEVEDE
jgi:hypothetical protein